MKRYDEDGKKQGDVAKVECIFFFFFSFRDEFTIQPPKDTTDIIFFFAVKKVGNSVNDSCCIFGKFAMDIIISPPFSAKLYHV